MSLCIRAPITRIRSFSFSVDFPLWQKLFGRAWEGTWGPTTLCTCRLSVGVSYPTSSPWASQSSQVNWLASYCSAFHLPKMRWNPLCTEDSSFVLFVLKTLYNTLLSLGKGLWRERERGSTHVEWMFEWGLRSWFQWFRMVSQNYSFLLAGLSFL